MAFVRKVRKCLPSAVLCCASLTMFVLFFNYSKSFAINRLKTVDKIQIYSTKILVPGIQGGMQAAVDDDTTIMNSVTNAKNTRRKTIISARKRNIVTSKKFKDIFIRSRDKINNINNNTIRKTPDRAAIPVKSPNGNITSLLKPSSTYVVPNIVHYVWFGKGKIMEFHHMLSILSAFKNIKPDKLLLHCDHRPVGKWWNYLMTRVNLTIVYRTAPVVVLGKTLRQVHHKSDIARTDILMEHGGIYLDTDVIALKSFDGLRLYEFTMGVEYHLAQGGRLNNGIIVSAKNATFLHIWRETYNNFNMNEWDYHSCLLPYQLMFQYPHIIHVENNTLNYPSGPKIDLIFDKVYDWSKNYAIHLWITYYRALGKGAEVSRFDLEYVKTLNTTFGQIARYVIYGSKGLI